MLVCGMSLLELLLHLRGLHTRSCVKCMLVPKTSGSASAHERLGNVAEGHAGLLYHFELQNMQASGRHLHVPFDILLW